MRLSFSELCGFGVRAVSRYTGSVLAVFVAQSIVAAACLLAIAVVLARAFAHLPMFDDAVDGDLVALLSCAKHGRASFEAVGGVVFGAMLLWMLASWFLAGGLYGVLAQRPEGRGDTARCFGGAGAATYLAYARLAVCSLPGLALVWLSVRFGVLRAYDRIDTALTVWDLLGPFLAGAVPGLLLLHFLSTVTDYARLELTLRHDTHDPGVLATYLRTIVWIARRPITLVHGAFGWLLFLLVTVAYAYLAQGHPMYGTDGAITLFLVRSCVSLLRLAIRVGVYGGEVELARTRPLPPRRVEAKVEAKS